VIFRVRIALVSLCAAAAVVAGCSSEGNPQPAEESSAAAVPVPEVVAPTALILDASDSMATEDAPGPRIDAARTAVRELVAALPSDTRLAVLAYGTGTSNRPSDHAAGCRDVTTLIPFGPMNRDRVRNAVDGLTPRGFTPIAESLRQAATTLPTDGDVAIVLVSDGEDTCGEPPCPVAEQLKRDNPRLRISTLGFKTAGPRRRIWNASPRRPTGCSSRRRTRRSRVPGCW